MLRYNFRYQLFLSFSDAVIIVTALFAASILRLNINVGMDANRDVFITPIALYIVTPLFWIFAYGQAKVYNAHPARGGAFWSTARRIVAGHLVATMIFLGVLYITFRDYSRLQAVYFITLALIGVLIHRAVLVLMRERLVRAVNTRRNVLIIGASANAQRVAGEITAQRAAGLHLVGYVQADADLIDNHVDDPTPIVGMIDDLPELVGAHAIDEIIIAVQWFDQTTSERVSRIMRLLEAYPVNIRIAPDYSELAYFRATPEDMNGVTLVSLREAVLSPAQRILKRLLDIVVSSLVVVLLLPLYPIVGLAIRLDSQGPIIFKQSRIGQHGRRFTIYKFRTMFMGADDSDSVKTMDDPRITRVGAWLRRTSIDELPQFVNVLKGEMSVVGPRPEVTWLASQYEWWQRKRFEVPQGITGWWQVNGRSDKPMRFHIEDDLFYVRNYSIWLDLQIMFRTLIAVITGKGAY